MSKSAEFPHSTSSRLLPKGRKNSAEKKKQSHSSAEFPNSVEKEKSGVCTTANFLWV